MNIPSLRPHAILLICLFSSVSFFNGLPAAAQDKSLADLYSADMFKQSMLYTQMIYSQAIYNEAIRLQLEKAGLQKINSGKASTLFQRAPTYLGPQLYSAQQKDPAERQKMAAIYAQVLTAFEKFAIQNNVKLNDVAEGRSLAFAMCYEVYSQGQHVSASQRNNFTQQVRTALLGDPIFQGTPDNDKQLEFEKHGINAALSASQYAAALRSNDSALRDGAIQIAAGTLKELWTGPLGALELTSVGFGDRGERLIREGKATTKVALSSAPMVTDPREVQLWREFVQFARSKGIAVNDLAETQALALAINYRVYSGHMLNARQFEWALREMRNDVLNGADWQGSTDQEKQRGLEDYVIHAMSAAAEFQQSLRVEPEQLTGVYLSMARSEGVDNASQARKAAEKARQDAKANLDRLFAPRVFDNYVLTENGFILKNGARP